MNKEYSVLKGMSLERLEEEVAKARHVTGDDIRGVFIGDQAEHLFGEMDSLRYANLVSNVYALGHLVDGATYKIEVEVRGGPFIMYLAGRKDGNWLLGTERDMREAGHGEAVVRLKDKPPCRI